MRVYIFKVALMSKTLNCQPKWHIRGSEQRPVCLGHSEQRFKREKEEMRFLRDPGAMSSKGPIHQDKKLSLGKPLEGFTLSLPQYTKDGIHVITLYYFATFILSLKHKKFNTIPFRAQVGKRFCAGPRQSTC